ncbi:MAG: hypothetical protein ABI136_07560 [Ginsengibacter sp.]
MHYNRRFIFIFFGILFSSNSFCQIFGGDPSSIKWRQINTPYSRVIFPRGLDSVATRITNIISFTKKPTLKTIGNQSKKINIVLQNQTIISNGYVGLGPFRSEFYLTPQQNSFEMGSIPWPDQLTIHEYRHVEQYNNFNVGVSKLMGIIFGEEGRALANNAAIPNWFYEGDAVYNETILSAQGRGKLPEFFDAYRSLWKAGKNYSWMKLRNGSLKDFVPDHYALGYLLVAYGYQKYGDDFWKKVTHDAAAFKSPIYPFQHAIKKYSGLNYVIFRNDAFEFFKKEFNASFSKEKSKTGKFKNEQFPSFTEDGAIIFVKNTSKQTPGFIIKKDGIEKRIRTQDYSLSNYFSYRNGKIVYSTYQPDIRWGYRDYNNLRIIDLTNGKEQTLSEKTKYFSPDISEHGQTIVVAEETPTGKSNLCLINSTTGKLIKKLSNPQNLFYTYPKFYGNQKIISAVRNRDGKMSLAEIDVEKNETKFLLPFSYHVMGFPTIYNDTLYFSLAYKKNVDLFAYTFFDKKLWSLNVGSSKGIGKYHPFVNDDYIGWYAFTAEGNRIEKVLKSTVEFNEIIPETLEEKISNFGITDLDQNNESLLYKVPNDSFTVTKYHKSFQLFNFHSIEPAINDPQYKLSLISENILNTLQSDLSFTYNRAEKYKEISFEGTYGGWFPFLSAGVNYFVDRSTLFHQRLVRYNQLEPFAGFNIPLNLSNGRSFTQVNFGSQYVYSKGIFTGNYKDSLSSSYSYSSNSLSFNHSVQKASEQIFPSFVQSVSLSYKKAIQKVDGFQFMANGNFYFPGFSKTHSLVLNGAWLQKDSLNQINFSNGFPFSRGYQAVNFFEMFKWGINYHFPIAFPDKGFGNILYLVRVRSNIFYDDTKVNDFYSNHNSYSRFFRSAGTEITFDTKWWNEVSISFGIRYSRLLDKDLYGGKGNNRWEIILPINILDH